MAHRSLSEMAAACLHKGIASFYLRKPELHELLAIKFPRLRSLWPALLNEIAYLRGAPQSFRLTSLNIEVTNFCNLSCTFCPVNRGLARRKAYLDPALFRRLIDVTPTLEFVMPFQWGEPLLHPEIFSMVRYAAARGLRTMLTTNGTLLDERRCVELATCGLTRVTISVDGDAHTHETVRGFPLAELRANVERLRAVRDERRSPLRIDASMVIDASTRDAHDTFVREWRPLVDRVQAIPRLEARPRTSACREPWRGALVVLADGRVTVCCADAEGQLALGNVHEATPTEIFHGKALARLRAAHARREFPGPCAQCAEHDAGALGIHARFSD